MKQLLSRYRGSYFCYVLTFFCYFLVMSLFSSVLSVYLTGIGKSDVEMSFIVSASGIFSFIVLPVVGYLNDLTRRPKLISCVLLAAGGLLGLVFALCRSTWALFLLDGCIMSFINSLMPITERMAGASRYRYGSLRMWGSLGWAVGVQSACIAIERFPPMALFVLICVGCGLAILGFWGTVDISEGPASPQPQERRQKPRLRMLARDRQFLLCIAVAALFAGCSGIHNTYAPILLHNLGMATGEVGTVLLFSSLIEVPIILFSNRYMDRFSGKALMLFDFALMLVQFLCYGLVHSLWPVAALIVLLKAAASTIFSMTTLKIVRNLVDPSLTTTGLSVVNSMNNLSIILLQNAGGLLAGRWGIPALYLCLAGLVALGMALALFLQVKNSQKVFS